MFIRIYQEEEPTKDTFHDTRYAWKLVQYLQTQGFTLIKTSGRLAPAYQLQKQIFGPPVIPPPPKSG